MFTLTVENANGNKLTLTQNESVYQVVSVTGLNPPKATLYTNQIAGMDGAKFKSSKLATRNIVITVKPNGDVEANRQNLYRYFQGGKWCKIFYKNANRDVYAEGYVETIDGGLFTNDERLQISIVCPNPYWKSIQEIFDDISKVFAMFEFPFAIEKPGIPFSEFDLYREAEVVNRSEIECGMVITLTAGADGIANPKIYDADTGEFIKLDLTMNQGDTVIINTNQGEKSVKKIVDGIVTNAINSFGLNSTWLKLKIGVNHFTYAADANEAFLNVGFDYHILYEGV